MLALDQVNEDLVDYVTTDFVEDFYKVQLEEKAKGSPLYRDVLSKFDVTYSEITLVGELSDLGGIPFPAQMDAYIRLSKNPTLKRLIENKREILDAPLMEAINNKQSLPEYSGTLRLENDFAITRRNSARFIRKGDNTYEKVADNQDGSVYSLIKHTTNPNF